ncbi:MAG TPA: hypothetical protein VIN75_02195 [Burkholderiaceae bacterium]
MTKTSFIARVAAGAAALVVSATASAEGTFAPELGIGWGGGKEVGIQGDRQSMFGTAAFGYTADNGLGGRLILIADMNIVRGAFFTQERSFDNFIGVQGTMAVPLAERLKFVGGLGIGRTHLDDGSGGASDSAIITDGLVSAGLRYRFANHYAMEALVSHLTTSDLTTATLQFQVPF